jgi:muconolactone delta-isomerase
VNVDVVVIMNVNVNVKLKKDNILMLKAKLSMALARALYSRKKLMKIKRRVIMYMRYLVDHYLQKDKRLHRKCGTKFHG